MILWETEMAKALSRGKAEHKEILVEFFSPECIGCKQMEEVTFSDQAVENFIMDRMVPLRAPAGTSTLSADFRVTWTPTLMILDFYGREHQRSVGFIPADEMVPSLLLGIGKTALDRAMHNEAVLQFNTLLNGYPQSAVAAEAVYLRGVSRYKSSQSPSALKDIYQQLKTEYPQSEWTRRAEPFNLL